ncbi:MAG: TonB family protein [Candidatus Methylacidiphilales bacterium]
MAASTTQMLWPGPGDELPRVDPRHKDSTTDAPPLTPVALWVTGIHALLLVACLASGYLIPKPTPQPALLSLLDPGELTKGDPTGGAMVAPPAGTHASPAPSAASFSTPSESTPIPPQPQPPDVMAPPPDREREKPVREPVRDLLPPTQPERPTPTPFHKPKDHDLTPPPEPKPKPRSEPKQEPKPVRKPVAETPPAEPPPKPKIRIDLTEVSRPSSASPNSSPSPTKTTRTHTRRDTNGDGQGETQAPGLSAADIKKRLGTTMQRAGVDQAPMTGGPSGGGGRGDDFSSYRTLIRDQLFQAWDRPIALAGQKLTTIITIVLDRDGTISSVTLRQSSGNQQHDQTALDAARQVRKIKAPLPEGLAPRFDISFFLQD